MRNYTLDPSTVDFDEVFPYEETSEERLSALDDRHIVKYRTKTIKSGDVLECEIYPIWNNTASTSRAKKAKKSRQAQKNLNAKNALKNVIRLVNTNFTDSDIWGTFTYETRKLPKSVEEAEKSFSNFIRRLKYYAKKHGFPPVKYVYWTEFEDDEKKGKHRVHHHVITNFPDRDVMESLWRNGARTQTRRLQADESGYEGAVRYCMKDPKGTKRYKASKNLKKPTITVADTKFTRRKVNRIIRGDVNAVDVFESLYAGYDITHIEHKTSDYVTGAYLYVKMARRKKERGRKSEVHRQ